jgi:signal transduction histidine kinase
MFFAAADLRLFGLKAFLITVFFAYILCVLVAGILRNMPIFNKTRPEILLQNDFLDAMKKISGGDFNIILDVKKYRFHSNIAKAINEMAKNLGSLETMRQDFISNVSHEIQSPLTSITGFAALLKDENIPLKDRKHYIEIIETESKRLSNLSDSLLKLSALETADKFSIGAFRLDKQIEDIVLLLEPQWAKKNINISADLAQIHIFANELLLAQVWTNILHNAIKFTPENGEIKISVEKIDNQISCKISDTGIGIEPKDQIRIFERFYKADKARNSKSGGNGLGLSIVKKIVELHKGQITINSEIGKGAQVCIILKDEQQ